MSISLMTNVWRLDMPATRKMILLAMCDWANDEGTSCHPSMKSLAVRASISERQAKRVVHDLIDAGWVFVVGNEFGGAPGQTRHYRINVKAVETGDTSVTGDKTSRVTNEAGRRVTSATRRVTSTTGTGDTHVTQSTIDPPVKASTIEASTNTRAPEPTVELPDWLPAELWADWVTYRKAARKPMTPRAQELAIAKLADICAEGFTAKTVIENAIVSGWQGLYAPKIQTNRGHSAGTAQNRQEMLESRNRQVARDWLNGDSPTPRGRL